MCGSIRNLAGIFMFLTVVVQAQQPFSFSDSAVLARMKADVCVLAADSMEGRNSGTEGERKAYEYLIRQFAEAGLSPKGPDSSWLQPFPFSVRTEADGSTIS